MPDDDVTADLTVYLARFQRECDAALADLVQVCSAAAQAELYRRQTDNFRFGIARIILEHPEPLSEVAPQRAARSCFLGAIGKFVTLLDRLIASRSLAEKGMVVDRDITTTEQLQKFVNECLDREYAAVAKDGKFSNPKKVESFSAASAYARENAKAYFQLRRALEHHDDVPESELVIRTQRIAMVIDGNEVKELPCDLKKGQALGFKVVDQARTVPAGQKIVLTPQDALDLMHTMRNVIAPDIFKSHVG
jgi:hypothetical protein